MSNSLRAKTLARQSNGPKSKSNRDYDPEEDVVPQNDSEDEKSFDSDDDREGTEHYVEVENSKLRTRDEVALGPQYVGSRISRNSLLGEDEADSDDDDEGVDSRPDEEVQSGDDETSLYADPDASEMDVDDDDAEIDSNEAIGSSDMDNFDKFVFRGSSKPRESNGIRNKRSTAADFMSDSDPDATDGMTGGAHIEDDASSEGEEDSNQSLQDQASPHKNGEGLHYSDDDDEEFSGSDSGLRSKSDDADAESDTSEEPDNRDDNESRRRAQIRKMMSEEQKDVVATISRAAKQDVDKGNAVKQQRKAFDALLNVRIRLQKGLVAVNTMAAVSAQNSADNDAPEPYKAAEEAALKLWNTLDDLRHDLSEASTPTATTAPTTSSNSTIARAGQKRKRPVAITASTALPSVWAHMQELEAAALAARHATLDKWSAKVRGATSAAGPTTALRPLQSSRPPGSSQGLVAVLRDQLAGAGPDRLVARTRVPRSCAPLQAQQQQQQQARQGVREARSADARRIFDDADFYQLLLKELVEQRLSDAAATGVASSGAGAGAGAGGALGPGQQQQQQQQQRELAAVREAARTRKSVDTRASKGRKLRYTVHEKLQNFMAPEDRSRWEECAVDRLFGALLGQRVGLGEREEEEGGEGDGEEDGADSDAGGVLLPEESLMLFRS